MILNLTILALCTLKDFRISACIEKIDTTFLYTLGLHNPVGVGALISLGLQILRAAVIYKEVLRQQLPALVLNLFNS